jgi:DNA polymerase III delta subunit
MPREAFSEKSLPPFDKAPSVVLVTGDVEFFVEEAASRARDALAGGGDTEVLRFEDDAPADAVSDALLNRSLFSPRRIVELDVSRLLGTETPGKLLDAAVGAWDRGGPGGRREAFRHARALLSALDLPSDGDPAETAAAAAKKVRRKEEAELFAEILKELPAEKSGGPAALKGALRVLLERGKENDGTVAVVRAVDPPSGVDLLGEIEKKGLVLEASVGEDAAGALRRLAGALAKERDVAMEPAAVERLIGRTDAKPAAFAAELSKLLEWAGKGGRIRAADVVAQVEDGSSEEMYSFYDAIGRRDAGEVLSRLERLLSGRPVRMGREEMDTEDYWPVRLLGLLTGEIRRMLLLRARLDEAGVVFSAGMPFPRFQAQVLPHLTAPVRPFGRPPAQGKPYGVFKLAERASRYKTAELARALARAADVDVALKNSAPPLETLSVYLGQLVAGT